MPSTLKGETSKAERLSSLSAILRVLCEVLSWDQGAFYFHNSRMPEGPILLFEGFTVERLLMECSRIRDERAEETRQQCRPPAC